MNEQLLVELLDEEVEVHYCNFDIEKDDLTFPKMKTMKMIKGNVFVIKYLRSLTKKQLKQLFYHIGLKQVMKISAISTDISLNSILKNDFNKEGSLWKVIV